MRLGDAWDQRVLNLLLAQVHVQEVIDVSARENFLPNDDVRALREAIDIVLGEWTRLGLKADRDGDLCGRSRPRRIGIGTSESARNTSRQGEALV